MLKRIPLHPYLLSCYSVMALVALNLGKFVPWMALRSLIFFLLVTFLLYWPIRWILHDKHKAALLLTLFLIAFFTYGHIQNLLSGVRLLGIDFSRNRNLLLFWLVILFVGVYGIVRTRRNLEGVTQALNVVLFIAVCFPIVQMARFEIQSSIDQTNAANKETTSAVSTYPALSLPNGQEPPDIYFIILDTYGRSDTLKIRLQFDNSAFENQLKELGFYIAKCSQSNYASTEFSFASFLNMDYLDDLGNGSSETYSGTELNRLIQDNAIRQLLKDAGYRIIAFDSGFSPTEWKDADVYLSMESDPLRSYLLGGINTFESLELKTSAGLLLYKLRSRLPNTFRSFLDAAYTEHRGRILYEFDKLATLPKMAGPKFVFVHILAPHSPFVFGAHGEIVGRNTPFTLNQDQDIADPNRYIEGYRNQVQYVNHRTIEVLKTIINSSQVPPVIIVQGDHGPKTSIADRFGRLTILNAYYLPGGSQGLYETITPVNSFRIIFNRFLGGQFDLLPDLSYYSSYKEPDVFTVFPSDATKCTP